MPPLRRVYVGRDRGTRPRRRHKGEVALRGRQLEPLDGQLRTPREAQRLLDVAARNQVGDVIVYRCDALSRLMHALLNEPLPTPLVESEEPILARAAELGNRLRRYVDSFL